MCGVHYHYNEEDGATYLSFCKSSSVCTIQLLNTTSKRNLERDCIKSRRDKFGIARHIMMHQVLYNVHVTLFIGQLHNKQLVHHDMPCDPNLVSSVFHTIPFIYLSLVLLVITLDIGTPNTYVPLLELVNTEVKG